MRQRHTTLQQASSFQGKGYHRIQNPYTMRTSRKHIGDGRRWPLRPYDLKNQHLEIPNHAAQVSSHMHLTCSQGNTQVSSQEGPSQNACQLLGALSPPALGSTSASESDFSLPMTSPNASLQSDSWKGWPKRWLQSDSLECIPVFVVVMAILDAGQTSLQRAHANAEVHLACVFIELWQ